MKSSSEQIKNRSRIKNLDLFFMSRICLYISVIFNTIRLKCTFQMDESKY